MTTAVDPENTPIGDTRIEGTVFTPRHVRLLKIAVVVMGIMILAGLAAVIAGMIFQASKLGKKTPKQVPAATAPVLSGALSALTIPEGGEVASVALDGDRLAVHLKTPGGSEIAIVDIATGKVLTRVKIETGQAQAQ